MWNTEISTYFSGQGPALLLLDLDGTLIDSVPDLAAAVDSMLVALGDQPVGTEAVSQWVGNGANMLVRRALARGNEAIAISLSQDLVESARVHFDQAYLKTLHHATGAFAGVNEFLAEVRTLKVLITNKPRMFTEPLIASLGWTEYFSFMVCGDDLAEKKPSPAPLLHACSMLAIDPSRALMIGDSRHDIQAAQAANIASVAVTYGYNHGDDVRDSNPDWVVDRLQQLLA